MQFGQGSEILEAGFALYFIGSPEFFLQSLGKKFFQGNSPFRRSCLGVPEQILRYFQSGFHPPIKPYFLRKSSGSGGRQGWGRLGVAGCGFQRDRVTEGGVQRGYASRARDWIWEEGREEDMGYGICVPRAGLDMGRGYGIREPLVGGGRFLGNLQPNPEEENRKIEKSHGDAGAGVVAEGNVDAEGGGLFEDDEIGEAAEQEEVSGVGGGER